MSRVVDLRTRRPRHAPCTGFVHVDRAHDGLLLVQHESRSGESWGMIGHFPPDQLEEAVPWALRALPDYPPARLGRVALPLELEPTGGRAA